MTEKEKRTHRIFFEEAQKFSVHYRYRDFTPAESNDINFLIKLALRFWVKEHYEHFEAVSAKLLQIRGRLKAEVGPPIAFIVRGCLMSTAELKEMRGRQ